MERLSGLAIMNIHYEKPVDYDAVVKMFVEIYPEECFLLIPPLTKHKIEKRKNAVHFCHRFASPLRSFVIFDTKRMEFPLQKKRY